MERGFYHSSRGYWQTIDDVSADIVAEYPQGTIEVPLKPGANYEFNGSAWVQVSQPQEPVSYRIGKSVPFRRMTDAEAVTVELLIASASAKFRLIWGAASYIDTRDELFPVLETMLSGALGAERAGLLLAAE